jgi:hypothetical protein
LRGSVSSTIFIAARSASLKKPLYNCASTLSDGTNGSASAKIATTFSDLRIGSQPLRVIQTTLDIDAQTVGILWTQGILLRQHRTFIQVDQLNRHRSLFAQLAFRRIQSLAQGVGIQRQQG